MGLAHHLKEADQAEMTALADYLLDQFDIQLKHAVETPGTLASSTNIQKAMGAWAYMQTNAADQGD